MATQVTLKAGKQWRFAGVRVIGDNGKLAKLDLGDHQPFVETLTGDGRGVVENLHEETEGSDTGHVFDVVIKRGPLNEPSQLQLKGDRDPDAGEVTDIKEDIQLMATASEPTMFGMGTGVEEDETP